MEINMNNKYFFIRNWKLEIGNWKIEKIKILAL